MVLEDVEEAASILIIRIPDSKTKISRTFTITGRLGETDPIAIYKKYVGLRSSNTPHRRLFVNYRAGKCTVQAVGIHSFSKMPSLIANYLKIADAAAFTGHCFRRSSASLLADAGADILTLKRHGGWKSSAVAEGYVDQSIEGKINIANKVAGSTEENKCTHSLVNNNLSIATNSLTSNLTKHISTSPVSCVNFSNISNCNFTINVTEKINN